MVVSTKPKEEQTRIQRWTTTASEQWNGFLQFLWNPEEKSVLGRNAGSWGRITIFYACYYSFLAALFAISITIVLSTLDPNVPRFQTRLQGPGVSIQPREESRQSLSSDIVYKMSDASTYAKYITRMDEFLDPYRNQLDDKYMDCENGRIELERTTGENKETIFDQACRFNLSSLGDCQNKDSGYGYASGQPCILVKVNRIVNWFPVGYVDLSKSADDIEESNAPSLIDALRERNVQYEPYHMYVACYGWKSEDQEKLYGGAEASSNVTYYPASGAIPFKFYPYLGKRRHPTYLSPVVAVQFNNIQKNQEITVACKAYGRNIQDSERMQIGYYKFIVKIEE